MNYLNKNLQLTAISGSSQKRAFFVLLCSIFYYHDMEEREKAILLSYSKEINGKEELDWACEFVKKDILSAFKRSKLKVKSLLENENINSKLQILDKIWITTKDKGYITEIEANLLLSLAREWSVEAELIELVKKTA